MCVLEALVVASKENGLEVNADKTTYMVMSRDQDTGRSYSKQTDNISFERVEEFKYLVTNLTNNPPKVSLLWSSGGACVVI
jgi:hypothetical protein